MAKGKIITADRRAAIIAALLAGGDPQEVAEQYKVSNSSVYSIRQEALHLMPDSTGSDMERLRNEKRRETIEELVIDALKTLLVAGTSQARIAAEGSYLREQAGNDLAVLMGVTFDKAFVILAGIARSQDGPAIISGS